MDEIYFKKFAFTIIVDGKMVSSFIQYRVMMFGRTWKQKSASVEKGVWG